MGISEIELIDAGKGKDMKAKVSRKKRYGGVMHFKKGSDVPAQKHGVPGIKKGGYYRGGGGSMGGTIRPGNKPAGSQKGGFNPRSYSHYNS